MEISLRLVLLLIGFVFVAGIIWDSRKNNKKEQKKLLRREQNDFNDEWLFNETALVNNNSITSSKNKEMIVIHVMAKFGSFSGGELIDAFDEVNLYYGEMQIFYRYEN